jgi:hypothetical protein
MPNAPKLDPQDLALVAEWHQKSQNREWIAAQLSKKHKKERNPYRSEYVSDWLQDARDRYVVTVDIDPSFAIVGKEDPIRPDELKERFKIEEAIVIDQATKDLQATDLHTALANRTGLALCRAPINGTRFFVAGGRTVVQIARMMKRRRPEGAGNRIDPLSGRTWTGSWQLDRSDDLQRPLDADDAASILAYAFPKGGTRFSQIGHPLYADNSNKAEEIMREDCAFLPDGRWNWATADLKTNIAICGIGILHPDSGHRMMSFLARYFNDQGIGLAEFKSMFHSGTLAKTKLSAKPSKSTEYLSRVATELIDAFRFAKEKCLEDFADVGNRLYPCLPLPQELEKLFPDLPKRENYEGLKKRLDVLNRRAIVMNWSHLRNVSTWITAGGKLKLKPLWTLAIIRHIEERERERRGIVERVSVMDKLTTDLTTADELLAAFDAYDAARPEIKQWYQDLSEILFQQDSRATREKMA